ncbi:hypothetical protein [Actinomadura macrotermitis]|uniref:Uncharacterized protein n=1 Tax=Actinomadura macrotermitis TaxID=2585200 RepID=A0A7K0C1L3_9ACTN|nr:hypothetical protein [Actinomadura macrotermitis]MQY07361.1 hypothetical protein [Actinomadura macrotermitis]
MEYVDLNATLGDLTGVIDPTGYLDRLPELAASLPPGARAFATDRDHYDFTAKRCVKDLKLSHIISEEQRDSGIELRFRHNCWKHDEDLTIRYEGVTGFGIELADGSVWQRLGSVILDEVLPHEDGCAHEIAFWEGTLHVVCRDLTATWTETDCPDAPGNAAKDGR